MTLQEVYKFGTEQLEKAGIENPSVDAFYLLEYAAKLDKTKYLLYKDQEVKEIYFNQYKNLIERRMTREPYQYIINSADFAGLTFEVNPNVLIPRLDTEVLFEKVLRLLGPNSYVLDLCTGSGAIGISVKRYRPDCHVVLSDISHEALDLAAENVKHHHIEVARKIAGPFDPEEMKCGYDLKYGIRLIESDLFDDMEDVGKFDVIVSNPPYVTEDEYNELMPEVKEHEPKLALTAGDDGLDIYRRIAKDAPNYLKTSGYLALEIGCSQADAVSALLEENGFTDINVYKDLAGLDRVVIAKNRA